MHNACSYTFNVVSIFDEYKFEPKMFRGENTIKNFLHELLKTKDEILNIINKNILMIISGSEKKAYDKAIYVIKKGRNILHMVLIA